MQDKRIYTITETKLEMAYYEGFKRLGSTLYAQGGMRNFLILNRFCSYERESKWGRFHCKASLSPSSTLKIYAFAVDAESGQAHELNAFFHNQDIPSCFMRCRGSIFGLPWKLRKRVTTGFMI